MKKYVLRLDDASERRNVDKWNQMEELLDKYDIKPLVGVIPCCEDEMMEKYDVDNMFWIRVNKWRDKGWAIAMHGFNHVCTTSEGGLNPVNARSEFAGVSYEKQAEKIKKGISIFKEKCIDVRVFFAPSHTFDKNTIEALLKETDIRVISDTPANKVYKRWGMTFVPQQSGKVRTLPFAITTFCYHPNNMQSRDFEELEKFLKKNKFASFPTEEVDRKLSLFDKVLMQLYYFKHR